MDECGDRPIKYFYVRGHSGTLPDFPRIEKVPRVSYINIVDPNSLCNINDFTVRSLNLFASYNPLEREFNLQSFMRYLRTHSTDFHLRGSSMFPARAPDATNQQFQFFHGPTVDIRPYPSYITSVGIWDLDQISSRTTSLSSSSILGESLRNFFGAEVPDDQRILTLENIRDMLMERYPGHCIVIIMAGCRLEQTPRREAASRAASRAQPGSVEQREATAAAQQQRPGDGPSESGLIEGITHLNISGTSPQYMDSSDGTYVPADLLNPNSDDSGEIVTMEWSNPYRGRNFDEDIRNRVDPFTKKKKRGGDEKKGEKTGKKKKKKIKPKKKE